MSEIPSPIIFDIARSNPKPPHRKSKNGCKICKARKIKCDEAHPFCGNCYRRFPNPEAECSYDQQPGSSPAQPTHSQPQSPSSTARTLSITSLSSTSAFPSTSRALELRLFHHYSTVTCHTMPTTESPAGLRMWHDTVPSLAFACPHIYTGILSLSAQHLLSLLPYDSPSTAAEYAQLKAATYTYINTTVSAHREEMTNATSTEPLNRFTTSLLLAMHAKLRVKCEAGNRSGSENHVPYTLPVNYYILHDGARRIWDQRELQEWSDGVREYIKCYSHLAPPRETWTQPEAGFGARIAMDGVEFPYDPLPTFIEYEISISDEHRTVYEHALAYLTLIKQCILLHEREAWVRHRFAIAPSVFGAGFRVLMQAHEPVALLILARLYALQKIVDGPWWLQGTAEYEIAGLESLIEEEWRWGMDWPVWVLANSEVFSAGYCV